MTERDFLSAIEGDPADNLARLAYADWLDEQARPDDALCWRWMGRRDRRPGLRITDASGRRVQHRYCRGWWHEGVTVGPNRPPHALLPRLVFLALPGTRFPKPHRYYAGEEVAVWALRSALCALRDAVRA